MVSPCTAAASVLSSGRKAVGNVPERTNDRFSACSKDVEDPNALRVFDSEYSLLAVL